MALPDFEASKDAVDRLIDLLGLVFSHQCSHRVDLLSRDVVALELLARKLFDLVVRSILEPGFEVCVGVVDEPGLFLFQGL